MKKWGMHEFIAATILGIAFSSLIHAAEIVTVKDTFNLEFAQNPQISPNGKMVVYERHTSDVLTDRRYANLWMVNSDGSGHKQLTSGPHIDGNPRWSPQGEHFIFTSNRDQPKQIYRYSLAEEKIQKLTDLRFGPDNVRWSPNGEYLSFVKFVPSNPLQIAELPNPPEGAVWAEPAKLFDQLRYRWDGIGYLERGMRQVFIVPSDGGAIRQISDNKYPNGGIMLDDSPQALAGAADPVWSPDNRHIFVSTVRRDDYEKHAYDTEIFRIALSNGNVKQLTTRTGPDAQPTVSPDGNTIAFLGYDDHKMGYQPVQLYLMDSDGGNVRSVTPNLDRDVSDLKWSKNGKSIYFQFVDRGETKLANVSVSGDIILVARNIGSGWHAYPSGSYSISDDEDFVFTQITGERFGQIAIGNRATKNTKVIVDVNDDVFTSGRSAPVQKFSFQSSVDNLAIDGWIVLPPGFDPEKKYPLILEIHGGPFANYGLRYDIRFQSMAARGFVVLYTNPRGSTSYGADFGNHIHHRYPGDDYIDLMSSVDAIIERGYIDERNLFVAGGSGGGILTAWIIGQTDRFNAASILYPAVNFASWALTTDKAFKITNYFFPAGPWSDVDYYRSRSPITYVDKVKTPTLIMTGEKDYRTPISESEQLYTALKLNDVDAIFARFPDEGHGIGNWPSHKISTIEHTIAWFEQHLKE